MTGSVCRRRPVGWMLCWTLALACSSGYRPARFRDHPPITQVADTQPTPVPAHHRLNDLAKLSNAYLRLPVIGALDASRPPPAGDVNSWDEVPASSWHREPPSDQELRSSYQRAGPPEPPLRVVENLPALRRGGLTITDRRGLHYEVFRDPARLAQTTTAAAAIASRLVHALGYFTPEVWVVDVSSTELRVAPGATHLHARLSELLSTPSGATPPRVRLAATRWPGGIDAGHTLAYGRRDDDPNDRVAHEDRRTLRALRVLAAWLDLRRLGPHHTRDLYVGSPGKGHLTHYLVDLHGALGAGRLRGAEATRPIAGHVRGNAWVNLATLGLIPEEQLPDAKATTLGVLSEQATVADYARFYEPAARIQPDDAYWMAKRIQSLSPPILRWAVAGGKLDDAALADELVDKLQARRRAILQQVFAAVTPLEVVSVDPTDLVLEDRSMRGQPAPGQSKWYLVRFIDSKGAAVAEPQRGRPRRGRLKVILPPPARGRSTYLVVMIRAEGADDDASHFEAHLVRETQGTRVVGIRH